MKTIETKIAKNGAQLWYVDGKRVSRETAQYHERENERYQEWLEKVAMERLNAAIDDYAVTVEAQDAAAEAETEQATEYAPVKFVVGKKYRMAPYKVDTITIVKRTAKTVEFVIDDDDDEAQVIRRKISSDCGVESISYGNSNTLDNFWVEAKDIVDEIEQSAGTEEDTETKAERIAALERGIERIINERQDAQDELEDADADAIATAIENLPDDMQAEVAAAIEPFKAEYAAALEDIYVDDQTANGEIIPAADMLQFVAPFALTDHSLTAYRKNDDGTFTEDKAAFARLLKVENKIFNVNEPAPEKPDTPPETQSPVVEHMNRNAPAGWSIKLDKDKIRVEYQGKHVADTERLTKRDQLVPQAFFDQFIPLVDKSKTPAKMFLEHRYRELEDLETMQQSPDCPPDTRRKLDEMIEQLKRDIAEAEFGACDTVESFCKAGAIDENGDAWF